MKTMIKSIMILIFNSLYNLLKKKEKKKGGRIKIIKNVKVTCNENSEFFSYLRLGISCKQKYNLEKIYLS